MVKVSPGVAPRIALSTWKLMATVSMAWPPVAGRRTMAVTVPAKIVPAARATGGNPIGTGGTGSGSVVVGSRPGGGVKPGNGSENSGAGLMRSDWALTGASGAIRNNMMSRNQQLLLYMGRPLDVHLLGGTPG